jgi:hypothetical protein
MRYFALACVLEIVPLLNDRRSKAAIRVLASYLDDKASSDELQHAWRQAADALHSIARDSGEPVRYYIDVFAADAVVQALHPYPVEGIARVAANCASVLAAATGAVGRNDEDMVRIAENKRQVQLIHEIFGPLCVRSVALSRSWLTSNVLQLARTIHHDRAFDRLPILADALMDAGCNSNDVLSHCQSGNSHMPGCWVIDFVLHAGN